MAYVLDDHGAPAVVIINGVRTVVEYLFIMRIYLNSNLLKI